MAAGGNGTAVTYFILLGLTNRTDLKGLLFGSFLLIYTMTLMGNLGMMALIHADPHLHTPMYFFLSTLSFIDICYSSVVTPRLLADFLTIDKSISYTGCMAQMAFLILHGTAECLLLATMAYDRFVAICRLLLYHTLMSRRMCIWLVSVAYTLSIANSAVQTSNVFRLPFCGPNHINDYFCDITPLLQLVCSDTTTAKLILYIFSALATMTTLTIILVSYGYILVTIGRMSSAEGRRKALSTCASHFMAISLFYGTVFFMYIKPRAGDSMDQDKVISVLYTIVIPMLNPLIYSLRNREVKDSLRRKICGKIFP
ncbi:olfactory receptor 5AP2-like [Chelonoidis abingdonii]|uniref:olfactory receptor 5AP2-like n=1 Tax=Chelonoidis abingdonii TaxID=106734 RepID=UPI0013F1D6FB|nr:olfactory receptor 1020-like [Chelonoidis abingdonii]